MPGGRPNVLLVIADDHATHALSCYGSTMNSTPSLDRIAAEGIRFDAAGCTNALCAPSRATILTGTYSHLNGVRTLDEEFDARQPTFPGQLQSVGYQTAIVGKWHLGHGGEHDPRGFDLWSVLRRQGTYLDPEFLGPGGAAVSTGYVTDLITDQAVSWLTDRDPQRPFFLLVAHKAPHRPWTPDAAHAHLFQDGPVAEPPTLLDDYAYRSRAAEGARMRVGRDMTVEDLKEVTPAELTGDARTEWNYQRYIKDYLRVVASLDDNVGRLLEWLEAAGELDDTVVLYTSDQGFFLGDHGWYDKRFMYEESLRVPLLIRYPTRIPAGTTSPALVLNVDIAQTVLELAGVEAHPRMQGHSLVPLLGGSLPPDWRTSVYYRYWEHLSRHNVPAHWGVRTDRYKLVFYHGRGLGVPGAQPHDTAPEWELFDLERDPREMHSRHDDPEYSAVLASLRSELRRHQALLGDELGVPGS
jgi:arylsulfatase A-like enzyme